MLKSILDKISVFFMRAFSCFSLVTIVIALVGKVMNKDEFSNYISVDLIVSFFLFSLLFALSFGIADFVKNNSIIRRFLQFVLTYLSVAAVFFAGGAFSNYVGVNGVQNKGFSILAISFMFVIIYVVCGLFALICSAVKNKVKNEKKEYEGIFEGKE